MRPAVTLSFAKRQGADASRVVAEVQGRLAELRQRLLPEDLAITVTRDYGATAREKANELLLNLSGAIVAVTLVIWLALGWRGALVVFVSVPVSFALTLFVYYLFGYTLNRVTFFALIFVTGIVVDDSIIRGGERRASPRGAQAGAAGGGPGGGRRGRQPDDPRPP